MRRGRHVVIGLMVMAGVVIVGTLGYVLLGFAVLDALYQTVTTITTVGFREVEPLDDAGQLFTIVLIMAGVGTALYTLTVGLELVVEGHLGAAMERRRMQKRIEAMSDHVIVCGWGRVGRAVGHELSEAGRKLVVVDEDPERLEATDNMPYVIGDATSDEVLRQAGITRASALVAALETDAENLFVTLTGRALKPDLFIVSRAKQVSSVDKLTRAGADRVVNPQEIGGARMAAYLLQPHVTAFLDVVMRDPSIELRLEEVEVAGGSPFLGQSLRQAHVRDRTGALVLALRNPDGSFVTHPDPDIAMAVGQILIAIGTDDHLRALAKAVAGPAEPADATTEPHSTTATAAGPSSAAPTAAPTATTAERAS
jgi:voltage-gated potassium channel